MLHAVKREHLRTSLGVEIKFPVFAAIATADGILYFGSLDGKLSVVDLKTQKPAWVFQNGTSQQKLPAIQDPDGTLRFGVIMSENFYDHMVAAVSRLLSVGSVLASPVVVKDVVYVGSTDGNLYALD